MTSSAFKYGILGLALLALVPLASCGSKTGKKGPAGSDLRVEETVLRSGGLELKAVLTVPKRAAGQLVPGAVIVPTFRHLDRNGTFADQGLTFVPYKELADLLAERGIATVRYDKRTLPAYLDKINVRELTLEDYEPDTLAALDLLRNTPGVDPERLYFIGHGEGAVTAPAIVESKSSLGVRGLVLIAPPLLPYDQLIIAQYDYEIRQRALMVKFRPDLQEEEGPRLQQLREYREGYATAFNMLADDQWQEGDSVDRFYRKYWKHAIALYGENRERIARLELPVFLIQGTLDHLVIPQNLADARAAFEATGHIRVELLDPASHFLISQETLHVNTRAADLMAPWLKNPMISPPKPTPERVTEQASAKGDAG